MACVSYGDFNQPIDPLCNVNMHLITLLNILVPKYQYAHLNAKYHETTLVMKLLIICVT
jgi:hypothetical protein